jgi:protein ImuA
MDGAKKNIVEQLQKQILSMQGFVPAPAGTSGLFGLGPIESAFPNGIFPVGAIHEFISTSKEQMAASEGFIAGLLSKLMQQGNACLWISKSRMLFPPALRTFGVTPDRVIFIDLNREKEILWAMEEALKTDGLAAVIAELPELDFSQSRRLQLAVEKSRVTGMVIRTSPRFMGNTACAARWQIMHLPSEQHEDLPGVGFPRWHIELLKVRNGQPGSFQLEWAEDHFVPVGLPVGGQFSMDNQKQTG